MRRPGRPAPLGSIARLAPTLVVGLFGLLPLGACDRGERGGDGPSRPADAADSAAIGTPGEAAPPGSRGADSAAARGADPAARGADSAPAAPQGEWREPGEEATVATSASATSGGGTLQAVRAAGHDGYDRLVLEFSGDPPGYAIRYPSDPLRQCGSGRPIRVDAPHVLQVTLHATAAHDDHGRATVEDRDREPALPVLRTARLTCDFEGEVEWVLGLARRVPFRVRTLRDPSRLVVDLRHP